MPVLDKIYFHKKYKFSTKKVDVKKYFCSIYEITQNRGQIDESQ